MDPAILARHPKLAELRPEMQPRAARVIATLEDQGWQPVIRWAYRSAEDQARKYAAGYSKSATPTAHWWGVAVDLIDRRFGWNVTEQNGRFFLALRDAVRAEGLRSGGDWSRGSSPWKGTDLGRDVAHFEWARWEVPQSWRREFKPAR